MKYSFLPVLFWAMAISQTFAQKTLPPSAVSLINNLSVSVKKMLCNAGYGIQAKAVSGGVQSRFTPLQLDSTKSFRDYNLNDVQDSIPSLRTIYQYPQNHVSIATESQFGNGVWLPIGRTTQTTDALGRITHGLTEVFDDIEADWKIENQLQIFPHGNSLDLIDSVVVSSWNADLADWEQVFKINYLFGVQDRLEKVLTTFDFDGQPGLLVDNYFYDSNADNHLIESSLAFGAFLIPNSKKDMLYLNHQLIQTIQSTSVGAGVFIPSTRNTYAYNTANLVKHENSYEWVEGVNDWNPQQSIDFEYNNNSGLSKTETESFNLGQSVKKEQVIYDYIQDENLSLESTYVWDPMVGQYDLTYRTYYYYTGSSSAVIPVPRHVAPLQMSPNPTTGWLQISMGTEAQVQVFDLFGHLLSSQTLQPGDNLNLTALPTGIYQVTAQQDATYYAGKVVKQ